MKIDLIIPSHRNEQGLRRLLHSLTTVDRSALQSVVVVFNPAEPELAASLEKDFSHLFHLKALHLEPAGVNRARNLGAKVSTAALLLFLDDDEEVRDPELFNRHLNRHRAQSDMMVLGGQYVLTENAGFWSCVYHSVQKDWFETGFLINGHHYQLLGGHLSIKRELFLKYQFEERIRFGGAETELLKRLQLDEVPCCGDRDLSIHHHSKMNLRQILRKAYLQGKGHSIFQFSDVHSVPRRVLPGQLTQTQAPMRIQMGRLLYHFMFQLGRKPRFSTGWKLSHSKTIANGKKLIYRLFLFFEFLSDRRFEQRPDHQADSTRQSSQKNQIY